MATPKPIFNHSFQVEILDVTDNSAPEYFYAIEGLKLSYRTKSYVPGGYNKPFEVPVLYQKGDLVLIRPLLEGKTNITTWCEQTVDTLTFKLTQAQILVLNHDKNVIAQWVAEDVYPKGLEVSSFNLERQSHIVSETITLGYSRLSRNK